MRDAAQPAAAPSLSAQPESEIRLGTGIRIALWAIVVAPAAVALAWVIHMRTGGSEVSYWRLARQESVQEYAWERLLDTGMFPAYFVDRYLVYGLLRIPGFDFQWLHFAPWVLAALCCVVFYRLLIGHAGPRHDRALVLGGLFVFTAWTFNPSLGANWICGERLRAFLPPLLFLSSIWILTTGRRWSWRFYLCAVLAILALFSEKGGLFVWVALLPVVATQARRRGVARPWFEVGKWLVLGNLGIVLCYFVWRGNRQPGLSASLLEDPTGTLLDVAHAIGESVPRLAAVPQMAFAACAAQLLALALLVLLLCKHRRDDVRLARAMPWLAFAIYGFSLAFLLVDLRVVPRNGEGLLGLEWQREHLWTGSFLLVGIAGLASVYARPVARLVFPVGIGVLLALTAQDWHRGWEHLKVVHGVLRTSEAELAFLGVADGQTMLIPPPSISNEHETSTVGRKTADALRKRGLLSAVPLVRSLSLSSFDVQPEPTKETTRGVLLKETTPTRVEGVVRARTFEPAPGLVMLTRKLGADGDERVFVLVKPYFYGGGKLSPFARDLKVDPPFQEGEVVRAYGFEVEGHKAYPFLGQLRFGAGEFHKVEGS